MGREKGKKLLSIYLGFRSSAKVAEVMSSLGDRMTITLIDYQLLVLLVAAWASGCVTLYISEERRARKEYLRRLKRQQHIMSLEIHQNEAMDIANES